MGSDHLIGFRWQNRLRRLEISSVFAQTSRPHPVTEPHYTVLGASLSSFLIAYLLCISTFIKVLTIPRKLHLTKCSLLAFHDPSKTLPKRFLDFPSTQAILPFRAVNSDRIVPKQLVILSEV